MGHISKNLSKAAEINRVAIFIFLLLQAPVAFSQSFEDGYHRMTTQWLGDEKALDVINDGTNNKLQMKPKANQTGQFWKITPLGDGYFRLTTQWQGENKSLDVVNDGVNDKVQLANTSDALGQYWKITSVGNGYYRLTNKWLGEGKSLDILNDASKDKLRLADTANASGQYWKFTKNPQNWTPPERRNFAEITKSGFKVYLDPAMAQDAEMKSALEVLTVKLAEMAKLMQPSRIEKLKKVPVWIEYIKKNDGAMWYHSSKDWLLSNGYPEEMTKSVEISNLKNFIAWHADQPYMVLHEFAHAHQDQFIPQLQEKLDLAYKNALESGKYNSVRHVKGSTSIAYAMNNKTEYFAELSEAYFGKNDYYPFTRDDLKDFDPLGYELMQEAWD